MSTINSETIITDVREADYDRFLAIQLAPPSARAGLYAVTAFHAELARIAETVSEPLIGHIRLAWWREALEEIEAAKTPRNHPVVLALADFHPQCPEIFPWLRHAIEARAADVDTSLIAQEAPWLEYCDHTAGALHMAWAGLLGVDEAHHHAIRMQARAYAMIGLVRAIPFMHSQGWLRFPHAWMNTACITSLAPSDGVVALSQHATQAALALMQVTPIPSKPLRALSRVAAYHARCLALVGYNPYRVRLHPLGAVWQVMKVKIM